MARIEMNLTSITKRFKLPQQQGKLQTLVFLSDHASRTAVVARSNDPLESEFR